MINKQSLWFVTLFSLIIILGIYYFASDQTSLSVFKTNDSSTFKATEISPDSLSVLKVSDEESTINKIDELEDVLLDQNTSLEEKNDAYDELEVIGNIKKEENNISSYIKKEFTLDNFVKINDNQISVVISSNIHNNELANNIIRKIQEKFMTDKYITIKFEVN